MYADIIIDISHEQLDKTFQYRIPDELLCDVFIGSMVNVPFGAGNRLITGYVVSMSETPAFAVERIKCIDSLAKGKTQVESRMIKLAAWLKNNYGSTMNQALKTVIPVKETVKQKEKKSVYLKVSKEEAVSVLASLKKNAKAKYRLLEALIEEDVIDCDIVKQKLNISMATINSLCDMNVAGIRFEQMYRNPVKLSNAKGKQIELNEEQQKAVDKIVSDYDKEEFKTYLIHGVTGSGKTEVYLDVIEHVVNKGRQVIVLIPEIALTFQTVQRFYNRFKDQVSIMNSKMSKGERYDQYQRAKRGEISIMIGPRSALFTPFADIGLIVIDEEHEGAYKSEVTPKYHARETAIHIAGETNASVILGSATPSVESYARAKKGEYELITLNNRAGAGRLPNVNIVDLRAELKAGNRSIFSDKLRNLMNDRLNKKEQIMLFLNKRGVAGFISCRSCGKVMKCPHCDVSLTEHANGKLVCHYCGFTQNKITVCPDCGSKYVSGFRAGTEAVEQMVKKEFPNAVTLRMDMDTTKKKDGYEQILSEFANKEADILIGTQMIVKGHDFPYVTLMGVLAADMSLHSSDYEASERTFQLLLQAAGRAGRAEREGEVVIQTYSPEHFAVQCAANNDYYAFYEEEMAYRELLGYPPVIHLMKVLLSSDDEASLEKAANSLYDVISKENINGLRCLGPVCDRIYKIKDVYNKVIYVKHSDRKVLTDIYRVSDNHIVGNKVFSNVLVQYDIN